MQNYAMMFLRRGKNPRNFTNDAMRFLNQRVVQPTVDAVDAAKNVILDDLTANRPKTIEEVADTIVDTGKKATKAGSKLKNLAKTAGAIGGWTTAGALGLGGSLANAQRAKAYQEADLTQNEKDVLSGYANRAAWSYPLGTILGGALGGLVAGPAGIPIGAGLGATGISGVDWINKAILRAKGYPVDIIDNPQDYVIPENVTAKKETAKETINEPPSILPESRRALGIPEPAYSTQGPSSSVEEYIIDNANPNVVYASDGTPIPLSGATLDYNNIPTGQPVDNISTTTQTNPALLSPSPSSNNTSTDMLATLMALAGRGNRPSFSLGGNVMGGAAPFSYNDYLTPMEQNMLNSIQSSQLSNPDELRRLVNDYYNAQDLQNRTTAYRQQLGYKGDVPRDTTELERLLGENKFAQELLAAQNTLYDNVMKRADAMRMAQQYGIPYSVAANSMNSVLQYLINPYITAQLKRENLPYETLQKMIETVTTGEQNRQTEATKGQQNRETIDRLWGVYRTPIEMATLDSLEKRTSDTNKTRRQLGYNQALIAEANMRNQRYLQQIGLPVDMAKAYASVLSNTIAGSQQYNQIMNMLNMLTGMDMMSLGSNLVPTGASPSGMVDDTYDWIE